MERVPMTFRIDPEVKDLLAGYCARTDHKIGWCIERAIRDYCKMVGAGTPMEHTPMSEQFTPINESPGARQDEYEEDDVS